MRSYISGNTSRSESLQYSTSEINCLIATIRINLYAYSYFIYCTDLPLIKTHVRLPGPHQQRLIKSRLIPKAAAISVSSFNTFAMIRWISLSFALAPDLRTVFKALHLATQ